MNILIKKLKLIFIPCQENKFQPSFLRKRFWFAYLAFLLILKMLLFPFLIYLPKTALFAEINREILIDLLNEERKVMQLNVLNENLKLNQAALFKAYDMMEKDYFQHTSPEGIEPWYWFKKAGYQYSLAGENLGIGFLDSEEIHRAWNNSPSHRANLLNSDYQEIGIAVVRGDFKGNKATIVVQLFATPKKQNAEIEEVEEVIVNELETENFETAEISGEESEIAGIYWQRPEIKKENPGFLFKFVKFMTIHYHGIIQDIITLSLIILIIAFIIYLFIGVRMKKKELVSRTLIFGLILIMFILINKDLIIKLIPHNVAV